MATWHLKPDVRLLLSYPQVLIGALLHTIRQLDDDLGSLKPLIVMLFCDKRVSRTHLSLVLKDFIYSRMSKSCKMGRDCIAFTDWCSSSTTSLSNSRILLVGIYMPSHSLHDTCANKRNTWYLWRSKISYPVEREGNWISFTACCICSTSSLSNRHILLEFEKIHGTCGIWKDKFSSGIGFAW